MNQETDRKLSAQRRSARTRNRPVLVTTPVNEDGTQAVEESTPAVEESVVEAPTQDALVAPPKRRLPNFFSTVGKSAQASDAQEKGAAQARLARVTRSKGVPAKAAVSEAKSSVQPEAKKEPTRVANTPARPASAFKMRYIIGILAYLFVAEFIGPFEANYFQANHIDRTLTTINFFGNHDITISTLVFLGTLVILLIVLARFDLIPRSFNAISGQTAAQRNQRSGSSSAKQGASEAAKQAPPTMKQGVKGASDDLYQEYRANQRRERKK